MKPLTGEWVEKAEGDFATASREIRVRKAPNFDAVCFHAQQCAEKTSRRFSRRRIFHLKTERETWPVSWLPASFPRGDSRSVNDHSALNAIKGSTFVARQAGTTQAAKATSSRTSETTM